MGYYAQGNGYAMGNLPMMEARNKDAALARFREIMLDPDFIKEHARGGSWRGGKQVDWFYSWCDVDELAKMDDFYDVLEHFGFELRVDDNDDLLNMWYDRKVGQEELLLQVTAEFWSPTAVIEWQGEDGAFWRHELLENKVLEGRVVYD